MKIRDAKDCRYDLVSLGECMIRLSPPQHGRIEFAPLLEVWVGGGEYNVSYALARLGLRVMSSQPGRHVFFQAGEASVLLAFLAESTLKGNQLPPHGTTGPGHFTLVLVVPWRSLFVALAFLFALDMADLTNDRSAGLVDNGGRTVRVLHGISLRAANS